MLTKYFGNQDKPEGMGLPDKESKDFELLAPHTCDLALQRGFYFSFRLPDWARDFKEHTREIIASSFHETNTSNVSNAEESKLSKQKSKYFHGSLRPDRYGMISETMDTSFFNEMQSKSGRPERSPKIKDDVTCKKRV